MEEHGFIEQAAGDADGLEVAGQCRWQGLAQGCLEGQVAALALQGSRTVERGPRPDGDGIGSEEVVKAVRADDVANLAEGAQVINMSSASAIYGTPDFASYSASKHAVRALTEALDLEWEPHGIRVTDLMPPFVNTGMVQANLGASRLFDTLGVDLAAADIAEAAWQLVRKPRVHRPVSWRMRLLWPVSQVAPAALTRGLMRVLRRA